MLWMFVFQSHCNADLPISSFDYFAPPPLFVPSRFGPRSVSFCFLLLWSGRDRISQSFIFFPPSPPLYSFDDEKGDQKIMFLRDDRGTKVLPISAGPNFQIFEIPTSRGERLASYYIKNPRARYSVLFCHGNASDIGAMRDHLIDFSQQLTVSVFVYDYAGFAVRHRLPGSTCPAPFCLLPLSVSIIFSYGLSTGSATPSNVLADAEAAYEFVTQQLQVSPKDLIM